MCFFFLLFTNTQQSFKFSSFIERRRGGDRREQHNPTNRTKRKHKKNKRETKQNKKTERNKPRLTTQPHRAEDDRELTESHTCVVCTSITEVATQGEGGHTRPRLAAPSTHARTPRHARPTHTHTHRHARRAAGEGRRASPVRVLLYVIIGGGTIKEAGVEGLPLLPSGEDAGDGAESHLLFLLFPFLVFKIL